MHEQDMAILKSLVAVAWADGHFAAEEREHLEALRAHGAVVHATARRAAQAEHHQRRQQGAEHARREGRPASGSARDRCRHPR